MSEQARKQDEITDLNKEVAQLEVHQNGKQNENVEQDKQFDNDRVRILQNTFTRLYEAQITTGFDAIVDYIRFERHKEKVIKRTLYHWRRHNAFILMSVMKQWAAKDHMNEQKELCMEFDKEMEEMTQQGTHTNDEYVEFRGQR